DTHSRARRPSSPRPPASPAKAALKRILGRLARLLPPPRDEALVALARSAWALARGHGIKTVAQSVVREPSLDSGLWERAESAFDQGRYDEALVVVETILERAPRSLRALRLKRNIQNRRGDLVEAIDTVVAMREVQDDPSLAAQERGLVGRLVETDPRWLPRVAGPARPIVDPEPASVMHLLKESLPYQQNGFTLRSRYTLLSQRDAGLRPFVVTSLGFPRKDGVLDFPTMELVDGIEHHRLDLGPGYPAVPPFDEHLTDYAWMAARVARRKRPAVIHASSGFRGYETALVGRALREHLRRPLVYEVRSFFEATWSPDAAVAERGEHYRLRYETENRCMQAADVVITIAEAMRDDIAARGVPRDRIHLLPNGVDPDAFAPEPPDPELRRRYGLEGRTVFGYVSTLDHPREGQELLVEATAILLRRGRNVACLIVGDGRRRRELEQLARRTGVAGAVHFTGRVPHDQVRAHYALLDIFVVPRRNDRAARLVTPLKPFEALAMGKPLVVADLPALVEIAAPGERGLSFPAEDAAGLADTLETLIDHPEQGRRFGETGRAWVLAERTWSRNGDRYRAIVDDLLERWDGAGSPAELRPPGSGASATIDSRTTAAPAG
ncbi:MAG TPA: glycosyltransferase, partial [Vitreimonas sp.]|nr:glycosyltransferase [Vitreimonas sp.]